jgi:predicted Zn-ribbon and HTH transcriptional regulator
MSADNWTVCPKCESERLQEKDNLELKLRNSYGVISLDEYKQFEHTVKMFQQISVQETLREDYEIGIRHGEFSVSYSSSCEKCKFRFSFSVKDPLGNT